MDWKKGDWKSEKNFLKLLLSFRQESNQVWKEKGEISKT